MGIDIGAGARLAEYLRDPRRAITEEDVLCLMSGRCFRHLTNTHLRLHGLTSDQYKHRFGYNSPRALMFAAARQTHAATANRLAVPAPIRSRRIPANIDSRTPSRLPPDRAEER